VIREDKFLISKRPYAIKLDSLIAHQHRRQWKSEPPEGASEGTYWHCQIDAAWFRRRRGVTVAVLGTLWDYQDTQPADAEAFLLAHDDGRYGGSADARWDGSSLWSAGLTLDNEQLCLKILQPMLENFPAIPPGYDGWWRF
jgi:hypothetical protein